MKSYLITDPKYFTNNIDTFSKVLANLYKNHHIDFACLRGEFAINSYDLAKTFVDISRENNIKNIFINSNIDLAISLNIKGVHLPSKMLGDIEYAKKSGLKVIYSTHNENEIKNGIKHNADYITYSPIFSSPNKGETKGVANLSAMVDKYKIKFFALGGIIDNKSISSIATTKCFGYASIRCFVKQDLAQEPST